MPPPGWMTEKSQEALRQFVFTSPLAPATLCGFIFFEGTNRIIEEFGIPPSRQPDRGFGRPHAERRGIGAIQFKRHNDGITWDSAAMERARP